MNAGQPPPPDGFGSDRWWPARLGGVLFLLVLVATLTGVAVVATGRWRWGTRLIGVALLSAAALRGVVRSDHAGMLAVRPRALDVTVLGAVGAAIIALSISIPEQPL